MTSHLFNVWKSIPITLLNGVLLVYITGCGGTELNPQQQREYEELTQKVKTLRAEARKKESKVQEGYLKSGRLEKKAKLKTTQLMSCGVSLKGQKLGPLPFKKKKGKSLILKNEEMKKKGGHRCFQYQTRIR